MKNKIAIVTPRYGEDIGGGAETAARGFAEEAVLQGWEVEIWTTCATSYLTWENVLKPGRSVHKGVTIHRFPILAPTHGEMLQNNAKATRSDEENVTADAEDDQKFTQNYDWVLYGPHSPEMYKHIARHGKEFSYILTQPYTYSAAHYASWIHPDRTLVWPCLHHETQVYSEPVRLLLESVHGVLFNAVEEQSLATDHLGFQIKRQAHLGVGIQFEAIEAEPPNYAVPHLVYVGRLVPAKNVPEMYRFVQLYAENVGEIHLTVAGTGPLAPPQVPYIDYRGFVSDQEKAELMASATAHWLPSISESFSIVTMESWLSSRPAIVHRDCDVPTGHVQRSKGGLAYGNFWEFAEAVQWLHKNPQLANRMGQNGKKYVEQNYTWPIVVKRFEAITQHWVAQSQ